MVGLTEIYSKKLQQTVEKLAYLRNRTLPEPVGTGDSTAPQSNYIRKELKQQQRYLTDSELEDIIQKYLSGISTYDLAKEYNCHRSTIRDNLKRCGVKVSTHVEGRKYQPKDVIRLYTEEMKTVAEIAKIYGVCDATIYKCLKRNDINTKRTRWDYK